MAVYYLCPDATRPAGGVRAIYDHVDVLNGNGVEAYVLHEFSGFRCTWFPNDTRVMGWSSTTVRRPSWRHEWLRGRMYARNPGRRYLQLNRAPDISLGSADVLVVPETFGPYVASVAPGIRKVIFNQRAFSTFQDYPPDLPPEASPYQHQDVVAVLLSSEHTQEYLSWAFPGIAMHLVPYAIDPGLFAFRAEKKRRIAFMPRRQADDARQVFDLLRARGTLRGFEIVPIDGSSQASAAEVMATSLIFLAVSHREGFGLPPAEAMSCGSIVVGYDAMGGREFMLPDLCFPVPTGDVLELARELESVIAMEDSDPDSLRARGRAAHEFIAERYSPERHAEALLRFWSGVLGVTS